MTTDKQTPDKPKRKAQKPQKQPKMDMFTAICKSDLKIEVVKEYLFHPTRKWRFDYAIPDHKIALEVEVVCGQVDVIPARKGFSATSKSTMPEHCSAGGYSE